MRPGRAPRRPGSGRTDPARRHVEQRPLLLGQIRDPGVDEVQHRGRDLDVLDHLRRDPGAVRPLRDELPLAQPPDDLEDEEGVAVGLHGDLAGRAPRPAARTGRRPAGASTRSFGPSRGQRIAARVLQPLQVRRPVLGQPGPRRPDQQDAVPGHRQGQRGEQRPPLLRGEVEVVDQDDRRALRGQGPRGVDEDRLEGVLRERLGARRARLATQQRGEGRDQDRR